MNEGCEIAKRNVETNVVVAGSGAAGLYSYHSCLSWGAKVVPLEKSGFSVELRHFFKYQGMMS